jgi:hypothetical protein
LYGRGRYRKIAETIKKLGTVKINLALVFGFSRALCLAQIPTAGQIGGWTFSGNANDMSGSGNHGTVFNATLTADRKGIPNTAYSFNGLDSYISMAHAGPTGTVSRSVSFWYKSTGVNIGVGFGYGEASSAGGIFQILLNYSCEGIGFDNSQQAYIKGNNSVNDGNWQHVVVIHNAANGIQIGKLLFYVNGQPVSNFNCSTGSNQSPINSNNQFPIIIGKSSNSELRFFKGSLDDFYLYNRALSHAEVLQLYNSGCPVPAVPVSISGNTSACMGASLTFSVPADTSAETYVWSLPNGWTGSSTTNTIKITPVSSGAFSVFAKNNCGQSALISKYIAVDPLPFISVTSQTIELPCGGSSATLSASGANSYSWSNGVTGSSVVVRPQNSAVYTVQAADSKGCVGTGSVAVILTSLPSPVMTIGGSKPACAGALVSIGAHGADSYTWQPGNLMGYFISVNPAVTTIYTLTGIDSQSGCINSITYTQQVLPSPILNVLASKTMICEFDTVTLTATGAEKYTWLPGNLDGPSIIVSPAAASIYSVLGKSANNCSAGPAVISVSVQSSPVYTVSSTHAVGCSGREISFAANGALNYTWQPENKTGFLVTYTPATTTNFTVTGSDQNGCLKTTAFTQQIQNCHSITDKAIDEGLVVFPNPASETIQIVVPAQRYVKITDMLGRVILFELVEDLIIVDIGHYPSAVYFVSAISKYGTEVTKKIVKI